MELHPAQTAAHLRRRRCLFFHSEDEIPSASLVGQDQLPAFSLIVKFQSLVSSMQGLVGAIKRATQEYRAVLAPTHSTGDWVPLDIPVYRQLHISNCCRAGGSHPVPTSDVTTSSATKTKRCLGLFTIKHSFPEHGIVAEVGGLFFVDKCRIGSNTFTLAYATCSCTVQQEFEYPVP